jgi:hypothetical protein
MLSYDNKFFDKTIYTKDTMAGTSIIICVAVRMALGAMIVAGYVGNWAVIALCAIILYVFMGKYNMLGNSTWKCYPKVLISYLTILVMQFSPDKSVSRGAGFVMMMDSLIALNSRHVVDILTRV